MAVSEKQFTLLNEMGIQLWQRRSLTRSTSDINASPSEQITLTSDNTSANNEITLNFQQIRQSPLFLDIIKSLSVSIDDVTCLDNILNLELINWQFNDSDNLSTIQLNNKLLITPTLDLIAQSSKLKRQLWQQIQTIQPKQQQDIS